MRCPTCPSIFGPIASSFLIPVWIAAASARRRCLTQRSARCVSRASDDSGEQERKLALIRMKPEALRAWRATILMVLVVPLLLPVAGSATALAHPPRAEKAAHRAAIDGAAARFDLPPHWIEAVIVAESGGDPRAVSPKGAMGLMQLMPATWREVRTRLGLGADPFDVRDNVLAGTFYLRQLHDRFGLEGALSAYNAGPQRYVQHLITGRPLPDETRAYVAAIRRRLVASKPLPSAADWRMAPLFPPSPPLPSLSAGEGR